jgi:membrane protease YdiL (CAAX protease family)
MNSEPIPPDEPNPEPPLVLPYEPEGEPPVIYPEAVRPAPKAQPHLGWAILWNLGFAVVLFGTLFAIVIGAVIVLLAMGDQRIKAMGGEGEPAIPRPLADTLAISFPIGYLAGLAFAWLALRVVVGRDWPRQIGLRRPALLHVVLVIVALPGFIIASDFVAKVFVGLLGSDEGESQSKMLRDLFLSFPWWFAVFAIGVCPGVVEELWCRGFLGRGLVGRYGWPLGIALTSLFFGMLHMYPLSYVIVTATMGIGLHLVYLATKSLWASMLLHTLNNSIAALASIEVISGVRMDRNLAANPILAGILAFGLLVFVGVALGTGRARVVPIDPSLPTWLPPFPGVAHPPPGANGVMRAGRTSPVALICAVASSIALVVLLLH